MATFYMVDGGPQEEQAAKVRDLQKEIEGLRQDKDKLEKRNEELKHQLDAVREKHLTALHEIKALKERPWWKR